MLRYLRTSLWFVLLLSPVLLYVFRRAPLLVLAVSLVPVGALGAVLSVPEGRLGQRVSDLSVFLFC